MLIEPYLLHDNEQATMSIVCITFIDFLIIQADFGSCSIRAGEVGQSAWVGQWVRTFASVSKCDFFLLSLAEKTLAFR